MTTLQTMIPGVSKRGTADKDCWQTPPELIQSLCDDHGFRFDFDLFASPHNAVAPKFWTAQDDTYSKTWRDLPEDVRQPFGNPPFSGELDGAAVRWAYENTRNGSGLIVAILTLAKSDMWWWRDYAGKAAARLEIGPPRGAKTGGRVGFVNPITGRRQGSPPNGQTVIHVFAPWSEGPPIPRSIPRPW